MSISLPLSLGLSELRKECYVAGNGENVPESASFGEKLQNPIGLQVDIGGGEAPTDSACRCDSFFFWSFLLFRFSCTNGGSSRGGKSNGIAKEPMVPRRTSKLGF